MSDDQILALLLSVERGIHSDCEYIQDNYRGMNQEIRYGVAWVLRSAVQHAIEHLSNVGEATNE